MPFQGPRDWDAALHPWGPVCRGGRGWRVIQCQSPAGEGWAESLWLSGTAGHLPSSPQWGRRVARETWGQMPPAPNPWCQHSCQPRDWGHPRRAVLSLGLAIAAGAHGCGPGCGQVSDRRSPSCLDSCPALRHHPCSWTLWALRGRLRLSPMHAAGGGAVLLSQDSAGEGPGKQSVARAGPLSQRARWLWRGWGSRTPRRPRTCWTGPGPATMSPVYNELTESSVRVL